MVDPMERHLNKLTGYHYYVFFLLFLSKWPMSWHILNLIFLSPPMDYYCKENVKDLERNGSRNVCPCENPVWDRSVFTETMQTKFQIYCENKWLVNFSQSLAYAGALVGCLVFGFLSDRFGRLFIFTITCLTVAVSGCLVTAMPTAGSFTFMRFVEGFGVGGAVVTSYVLCVEFCGIHYREIVTALFHIPINIGHITLAGVSYLLDIDDFQLAVSVPMFFFAGMWWMIRESPKWLMDNNHVDKAAAVLEKFTQRNSSGNIKKEIQTYLAAQSKSSQSKINFWQIFKHKKLTVNFVCMSTIYFVCGMGYYDVSQFIGEMSGDIHINVVLSGLLLLPGTIICIYLLQILGRRPFLMTTNFLSGLFMLMLILVPSNMNWLQVVCACICNSFYFMSFLIAFLYGVELFPTSVRNSVLGVLSVLARLGQIVNPIINSVSNTGAIYGTMAILGAVLCFFLSETKDTILPSSLEDSESFARIRVTEFNNSIQAGSSNSHD